MENSSWIFLLCQNFPLGAYELSKAVKNSSNPSSLCKQCWVMCTFSCCSVYWQCGHHWSCCVVLSSTLFLRALSVRGRKGQLRKQFPDYAQNIYFCSGLCLTWVVFLIVWARDQRCPLGWVIHLAFTMILEAVVPSSLHNSMPNVSLLRYKSPCVTQYAHACIKSSLILTVVYKCCLPFGTENQTLHRKSCFLWVLLFLFY